MILHLLNYALFLFEYLLFNHRVKKILCHTGSEQRDFKSRKRRSIPLSNLYTKLELAANSRLAERLGIVHLSDYQVKLAHARTYIAPE